MLDATRAMRTFACQTCGHVYGGPHMPTYRAIGIHASRAHGGTPAPVVGINGPRA